MPAAVITVKLIGQSKEDAMNIPAVLEQYKEGFEQMRQEGRFGHPNAVQLRFLVIPGKWE